MNSSSPDMSLAFKDPTVMPDPHPEPMTKVQQWRPAHEEYIQRVLGAFDNCLGLLQLRDNPTARQYMDEELWIPLCMLSKLPSLDHLHISELNLDFVANILFRYADGFLEVDVARKQIRPKWALRSSVFICNVDVRATIDQIDALLNDIRRSLRTEDSPYKRQNINIVQHTPTSWSIAFNSPSAGAYAAMTMKGKCIQGGIVLPMACMHINPPNGFYANAGIVVMEIDKLQYGDAIIPQDQAFFFSQDPQHLGLLYSRCTVQTPLQNYGGLVYAPVHSAHDVHPRVSSPSLHNSSFNSQVGRYQGNSVPHPGFSSPSPMYLQHQNSNYGAWYPEQQVYYPSNSKHTSATEEGLQAGPPEEQYYESDRNCGRSDVSDSFLLSEFNYSTPPIATTNENAISNTEVDESVGNTRGSEHQAIAEKKPESASNVKKAQGVTASSDCVQEGNFTSSPKLPIPSFVSDGTNENVQGMADPSPGTRHVQARSRDVDLPSSMKETSSTAQESTMQTPVANVISAARGDEKELPGKRNHPPGEGVKRNARDHRRRGPRKNSRNSTPERRVGRRNNSANSFIDGEKNSLGSETGKSPQDNTRNDPGNESGKGSNDTSRNPQNQRRRRSREPRQISRMPVQSQTEVDTVQPHTPGNSAEPSACGIESAAEGMQNRKVWKALSYHRSVSKGRPWRRSDGAKNDDGMYGDDGKVDREVRNGHDGRI